jgi:hypothetical protein
MPESNMRARVLTGIGNRMAHAGNRKSIFSSTDAQANPAKPAVNRLKKSVSPNAAHIIAQIASLCEVL